MPTQDFRTNKNDSLGGFVESALAGFIAGQTNRKTQEKAKQEADLKKLDYAIKLIDLQDKVRKSQQDQAQAEFVQNEMKSQGLLPYSPEEEAALRGTLFSGVGGVQSKPQVKTESAILKSLQSAKANGFDYSANLEYGGLKLKYETPGQKPGGMTEYQKAELDRQKKKDLNNEIDQSLKSIAIPEIQAKLQSDKSAAMNPALYKRPSNEEIRMMLDSTIEKYRPIVTKFKLGQLKKSEYDQMILDAKNKNDTTQKLDFTPFLSGGK